MTGHEEMNLYSSKDGCEAEKERFYKCWEENDKTQKLKARESGQTREGIGAMAVRLLWCYAFTDAPNTSVVLCSRGERSGWWWIEGRKRKVEEEGERGAEEEAMVGRVVHSAE